MKVYNKEKTQELDENTLNLEKGYLKEDKLITHFDAIAPVKEQGHYKTIKEYPNGGKDVQWVVDVKGIKGQDAYDKEEDIYVYIPYTEEDLQKRKADVRINELKSLLASTDYKAIKYAEGELTEEEYAPIKELRRSYRAEINQLEEKIKN